MSEEKLHRTVVYVESIEWGSNGATVRCTPAGVDLPAGCASVNMRSFPESMRDTIEHGKCFFAKVNLDADQPSQVRVEDIEEGWGVTNGPLHFEPEPNDRVWTLRAESGVWRVETGAGYPYTLGEKVEAVPKDALEAMEQRAELAEAFHKLAVDERDAERRKALDAEELLRRRRLDIDYPPYPKILVIDIPQDCTIGPNLGSELLRGSVRELGECDLVLAVRPDGSGYKIKDRYA
jgi:hypothetical protein